MVVDGDGPEIVREWAVVDERRGRAVRIPAECAEVSICGTPRAKTSAPPIPRRPINTVLSCCVSRHSQMTHSGMLTRVAPPACLPAYGELPGSEIRAPPPPLYDCAALWALAPEAAPRPNDCVFVRGVFGLLKTLLPELEPEDEEPLLPGKPLVPWLLPLLPLAPLLPPLDPLSEPPLLPWPPLLLPPLLWPPLLLPWPPPPLRRPRVGNPASCRNAESSFMTRGGE
jgi:hypothetical protein